MPEKEFKKNILYIFCFENYSGAEIVTERLIKRNELVHPLVLCPSGDFATRLYNSNIEVITENNLSPLQWSNKNQSKLISIMLLAMKILKVNFKLFRILFSHKVDVVHSNNLNASFYILPTVTLFKLFFSKRKFIWSNHDLTYYSGRKSDKLAALCIKIYDKTIAVSNAVKNKFQSNQDCIEILYNGLDLDIFTFDNIKRDQFRAGSGIKEKEIAIGIIGGIVPHKGHQILIEAVNKLLAANYNIKLFIIGKFSLANEEFNLFIKTESERSNGRIVLLQHTSNIVDVYCGLDVIVNSTLPEISEPLGTTIYEGMAHERIVLASNTGGSPEIIDDRKNGYLFEAGNLNSLTETLRIILMHFDTLDNKRKNARGKVVDFFNINLMVNRYNHIINKL